MKTIKLFLEMDCTQEEIDKLAFEINGIYHPDLEMKKDQNYGVLRILLSEKIERPDTRYSDKWLMNLARKFDIHVSHIERD